MKEKWEVIAEKAKDLPPEKQEEVLSFIESLAARQGAKRPLKSLHGLWAGGPDISDEDIAEVRREMSRNFPREASRFPRAPSSAGRH